MGEGEVVEVSKSPYAVQELPTHVAATLQSLAQAGDPVYRVTVRLKHQRINAYGTQHALKPGMLAEADILQDTRRLWEWALEPIFSVTGKLVAVNGSTASDPVHPRIESGSGSESVEGADVAHRTHSRPGERMYPPLNQRKPT